MLEVLASGLLDTVQDGGRPGARDLGVPVSGACDAWSLAVADRLLGNEPDAAALEITALGPTLAVRQTCVLALAGAELGASVPEEGRALPVGTSQLVHAGTRIVFAGPRGGRGLRTYLALAGGIDVPLVLGSRSTCLAGSFGGLDGGPLQTGDVLRPLRPDDLTAAGRRWPGGGFDPTARRALRLLPGPSTLSAACPGAYEALVATAWRVSGSADRMGLRLAGPPLAVDAAAAGMLVSRGVLPGTVQILPDGSPLVLLADAQTVGGYPVAGIVPAADLPLLGQLRPGDPLRFRAATAAMARAASRRQARGFAALRSRLERGTSWDLLADAAG
ncbi:MAG TPA: biotin-dependent carboxyltransferase family protein [Candidatus Limnocylindrales bacterium]|nr:biotin-dependent carboxyltransferase family protein [Candidatus Limnocylindrales bacterium]